MVDYSGWLESWHEWGNPSLGQVYQHFFEEWGRIPHLVKILVLLVMVFVVLCLMFGVLFSLIDEYVIIKTGAVLLGIIAFLFVICPVTYWLLPTAGTGPTPISFAKQTERVYGLQAFGCKGGCPEQGFPKDRTEVSWFDSGKIVKGTIIVEGNKIGLVGPDGKLLKAGEQ